MAQNITHSELEHAAAAGDVQAIRIIETAHGFELYVKLDARYSFLATVRDKDKPRIFRSLDRLMTVIRGTLQYNGEVHLKTRAPFLDYYTQ